MSSFLPIFLPKNTNTNCERKASKTLLNKKFGYKMLVKWTRGQMMKKLQRAKMCNNI